MSIARQGGATNSGRVSNALSLELTELAVPCLLEGQQAPRGHRVAAPECALPRICVESKAGGGGSANALPVMFAVAPSNHKKLAGCGKAP